jgi:peptidylprolyl isomerase
MKPTCSDSMRSGWLALTVLAASAATADALVPKARTMAEILEASGPDDWRRPDPENTLYLQLASGRVVIELAPSFAPEHVANIRKLVRQQYFDGLAIIRSQDNFVVQWGDADGTKSLCQARTTLSPEFTVTEPAGFAWTRLPDFDGYAPESGFSNGFPTGRNPAKREIWLAHCYGMLGVGRGDEPDSGNGAELYVVTGHAPRHLDRNIAVVGRVITGMELLSTLRRGTGPLGFYEKPEERMPIDSVRVASDVLAAERDDLELLRTDTPTFAALIEARRNRRDDWYLVPAGHIDLCNVPLPVRSR